MREFASMYPELVDKYQIKYPIEDELILCMPTLYNSEGISAKPKPKPILLNSDSFESLLTIWEFYNGFSDFLKIPNFKIEDLEVSLKWPGP